MPPRGTVIAYHGVGDCPRSSDPEHLFVPTVRFAAQMDFLARRRDVVSLDALVRGKAEGNRPTVAITFDDGFRSVLNEAAPILRRHGFPATVFVPTQWLGRRGPWYEAPGCDADVMSTEELHRVRGLGVEVESHGHGHIDLGAAAPEDAERDIVESVEALTELLGRPPRFLAYPWGRSSDAARRAAAAASLEAAFSIDAPDEGRWAAARVGITGLDGRLLFALKTSGSFLALRRLRVLSGGYALVRPLVRRLRGA